ncbi:MAG: hypothetical protein V1740_07380 [Candidatus Woesearchaeota archaeon]
MENLKILNKKETKPILNNLKIHFGFDAKLDFVFLKSNKNRIYLVNRDISRIDLSRIRINTIGIYIGELVGSDLRLSIEGSQIIGPGSNKNIITTKFDEQLEWLKGNDLIKSDRDDGYKIIKHEDDFIGCGMQKQGKILNFIPKIRRLALNSDYFSLDNS